MAISIGVAVGTTGSVGQELPNGLSEIFGGEAYKFGELATAPPARAIRYYINLRGGYAWFPEDMSIRAALANELAKNPKLPEYCERTWNELPHSHFNSAERAVVFTVLGDLRTEWSVELLGKALMDERLIGDPHLTEEEIVARLNAAELDHTSNHTMAFVALDRLDLRGEPTDRFVFRASPGKGGQIQRGDLGLWQKWWSKNGNNIPKLLAEEPENQASQVAVPGGRDRFPVTDHQA